MGVSTRQIKEKMKSVQNIGKITRAMEMVAASKMKRAVDSALATREYAELALALLANLSKDRNVKHPLTVHGVGERRLMVIVASNRGLCGGYNANIERSLGKWHDAKRFSPVDYVCIGKHAERIARRQIAKRDGKIIASFTEYSEKLRIEEIYALIQLLLSEFQGESYRKIYTIFTKFISALSNEGVVRQLLPVREKILVNMLEELGVDEDAPPVKPYDLTQFLFEPDEESVLELVLPRLVEVQMYQSLLEAGAAEHSARMVAMKNATENAGELLDDLKLGYNRARQESVTQEISEIAAGASAMQNA